MNCLNLSHKADSGRIASSPASPPPSRFPPDAPKIVGFVMTPPFAYHWMSKLGSDPFPAIPNGATPPLILMCGIFRSGSFQLKLKALFSSPTNPETTECAASSFDWNEDFTLSSTPVTALFAPFIPSRNFCLIPVSFPPVRLSINVRPDVKYPFTASCDAATTPLIPPPFCS